MGEVKQLRPVEAAAKSECSLAPLVRPGIYTLAYTRHEARLMFGNSPKLIIWFRILDFGKANGEILPRYYNLGKLIGKPDKQSRYKRFKVNQHTDLMDEFARVCPVDRTMRLDRVPVSHFGKHVVSGQVRTVTENRKQRPIHDQLQYSVIQSILGRAD